MNYFTDLYIEENEKFDAIITMFKLAGWEYLYDEIGEDKDYHSFQFSKGGYIEIIVEKGEKLKLDYNISVGYRKTGSHGGSDVELLLERLVSLI